MERSADDFQDSSLPETPSENGEEESAVTDAAPSSEEDAPAVPSDTTWSSDAAAELVPGEFEPETEDTAAGVFEMSDEEDDEVEQGEATDQTEPAEAGDAALPEALGVPEPARPEPDVTPELAAAVDEAFTDVTLGEASLADGELSDDDEDASLLDWQPGQWFVVHTYAGYENKVKTNLESRIVSMNMEEKIHEVVIPTEDVMEVKSGKKQVVQKKVFPGYLLVRMDLDDDSWYVVRNTPGVTGFVGSGTKPIPLSDKEVDRVLQRKGPEERPKPRLEFSAGDGVRVVTGPFANFQGVISEIDIDRSKLKVLVNIFGRETPVELGFDQVAKI